jgi:putative endonuclease
MYHVYILKSLLDSTKSYVGLTIREPDERLEEHNSGLSKFTKTNKPWKLIYYENFYCKLCAEKREKFLKSGIGYKIKKMIIDNIENI